MTVVAALNNFTQAIVGIGYSVLNAILAVFHAFLALGNEVLTGVVKLLHAVVALVTDLVQDTLGLIFGGLSRFGCAFEVADGALSANFFLLLVLGGGYYWWTNSERGRSSRSKGKGRI